MEQSVKPLLLTYQKREGELIDFSIQGNKKFLFKFVFESYDRDRTQVHIHFDHANQKKEDKYPFTETLPLPKEILRNLLGAWIRDKIWHEMPKTLKMPNVHEEYQDDFRFPAVDKETKKLKSYIYLRSKKIATILTAYIFREWAMKHNLSDEDLRDIYRLSRRIYPCSRKLHAGYIVLFNLRNRGTPELWKYIKSDFSKYNISTCKYLINMFWDRELYNISTEQYAYILKHIPEIVKKCKYGLDFDHRDNMLENIPIPDTRWQWFASRVARQYIEREHPSYYTRTSGLNATEQFCKRLPTSDIRVWHYFKKYQHIKRPYSHREIKHMLQTVLDGARFYDEYKNNEYGISFVPVDGSPMRMIRNAIYNHRQQMEYTKKHRLAGPNRKMCQPPVKLPDWIENIRLKTAHEMINAGIECQHCIGSYVESSDIFVREKDICAQISRNTLEIFQCFDVHDQITKASESLKNRLNRALEPIKEAMVNVK